MKELHTLRELFHQIPELAFEEYKTSEKIKEYLKSIGIEEVQSCTPTGVIAVIHGGKPGKTVGIRADIDGLPIQEETDVPYHSVHPGKMHACGHDTHIASVLYLAKRIFADRDKLYGNVKLIFQPAEEGAGGAEPMIEAGALTNPKVDCMLGWHIWPEIPLGKIDITPGTTFASSDIFTLKLNGVGGHGAMPEKVNDCIYAGAKVSAALKEWYLSAPYEKNTVISVCAFEAPGVHNVYPSSCMLKGTIRTLSETIRAQVKEDIKRLVAEVCDTLKMPYELEMQPEYPTLENNDALLSLAEESAEAVFGKDAVVHFGPTMAAEDFCYFSKAVPSCHIKIGCGEKDKTSALHHPQFLPNTKAMETAVILLEAMIRKILSE